MHHSSLLKLFFVLMLVSFTALAQATDKGLFWKMESPTGKVSYLLGTMHTDDNRVAEVSPSMEAAIKNVDAFMMEVEQSGDPAILINNNQKLSELLSEEEFDQVRELANFHTMHLDAAMRMKPWLLAVVFDLSKPQTPFNLDNLLMRKAQDSEKDVIGIETEKEHFGIMDDFSMDEQLVMLRAVLKRTPEVKEADFERLMTAYLAGDTDKISALDEQITGGMLPKEIWEKMRKKLLDDRNAVMAKRALEIADKASIFFAVGASHLAGDSGLIAAFKKAGYKLSAVNK